MQLPLNRFKTVPVVTATAAASVAGTTTTATTTVAAASAAAVAAAATLNRNNTTLTYMPSSVATTSGVPSTNVMALDTSLGFDPDSIIFNPNDLDDGNNFQGKSFELNLTTLLTK